MIGEHGVSRVVGGSKNTSLSSITGTVSTSSKFLAALTLVLHSRGFLFSVISSTGADKNGLDDLLDLVDGFLSNVAHVAFLGFFRLRNKLADVFYVDKGPREIVVVTDDLEPCGLGWESCSAMDVEDCFFDAGKFVEIIDCLSGVWAMWIGGE